MPDISDLPLVISTSGGETSMIMCLRLNEQFRGKRPMVNIFANTSRERDETLTFLDRCDKEYGLGLVWVEAVVNPEYNAGTTHRLTTYEEAKRDGSVFEAVIQKYGIPNAAFIHCTRELKTKPIVSYVKSELGWDKFVTAIGYRADEMGRVKWDKAREQRQYYPLVETWPMDKAMVRRFFSAHHIKLGLKEHEGNCKNCYKKSDRKLLTLAVDRPEDWAWNIEMEAKYGNFTPPSRDSEKSKPPYTFFRDGRSAIEIIEESKFPFRRFEEVEDLQMMMFADDLDWEPAGCGSGACEPF